LTVQCSCMPLPLGATCSGRRAWSAIRAESIPASPQRERMARAKKGSQFNLDDDDGEEEELTHKVRAACARGRCTAAASQSARRRCASGSGLG